MTSETDTSWRFFFRPSDTWEAMYRDCQNARQSIEFEQYILENDAVGRRFLELFIAKAAERVKIFILCDKFGSAHLSRSPLLRRLRRNGGIFRFYHDLRLWELLMPWRWFPRTHTKTLLIDSAIAYTGGVCIDQRMERWRDTHLRFTGSAVADVRAAFDRLESRRRRWRGRIQQATRRGFIYLQNRPLRERYAIYLETIQAIREGQETIRIATAYFAPNRRFLDALREACRRDVTVMLLMPERSDVRLADYLCLTYVPRLLRAGVRIFHYQETVMHAKTMTIDDRWATVGSMNMDVLSFFHNREANVVITEREAVTELRRRFDEDLTKSREITWREWQAFPLWKKALGLCLRLIKIFF